MIFTETNNNVIFTKSLIQTFMMVQFPGGSGTLSCPIDLYYLIDLKSIANKAVFNRGCQPHANLSFFQ